MLQVKCTPSCPCLMRGWRSDPGLHAFQKTLYCPSSIPSQRPIGSLFCLETYLSLIFDSFHLLSLPFLSLPISFSFTSTKVRGTKTKGIAVGEDSEEWGRGSEKPLLWNLEWSVSLEGAQKGPACLGDCWVLHQLLPQGPEVGGEWSRKGFGTNVKCVLWIFETLNSGRGGGKWNLKTKKSKGKSWVWLGFRTLGREKLEF